MFQTTKQYILDHLGLSQISLDSEDPGGNSNCDDPGGTEPHRRGCLTAAIAVEAVSFTVRCGKIGKEFCVLRRFSLRNAV